MEEMVMPFIDQSQNFTLGFECGQIWTLMHKGFDFKNYLIHTENKDQIIMMSKYFSYNCEFVNTDIDEWSYLIASKNLGLLN